MARTNILVLFEGLDTDGTGPPRVWGRGTTRLVLPRNADVRCPFPVSNRRDSVAVNCLSTRVVPGDFDSVGSVRRRDGGAVPNSSEASTRETVGLQALSPSAARSAAFPGDLQCYVSCDTSVGHDRELACNARSDMTADLIKSRYWMYGERRAAWRRCANEALHNVQHSQGVVRIR
ncbi:hypothetical protein BKA93DRAFT_25147 [Sparassis latifolia]